MTALGRGGRRSAGLELLRLLCMLAIVAYHYMLFGGYPAVSWQTLDAGWVFIQQISLFGRLACSIFGLISGYFLVESRGRTYGRKIAALIGEMCFYSLSIWAVMTLSGTVPFSVKSLLQACFPFIHGNWYAAHYILLLLLVPFLNAGLLAMTRRAYTALVAVVLTMWSLIPTLTILTGGGVYSFGDLDFLLVMYLIGGYIKLHVHGKVHYDHRWDLLLGASGALLLMGGVLALDILALLLRSDGPLSRISLLQEYNSVPSVLCAVFIFLYFSGLRFQSKAVERAAPCVLGVYLIHENRLIRPWLWTQFFPNADYAAAPWLHALLKISGVFFACLFIDLIRSATVGRAFERWLDKNYDRLADRFKALWKNAGGPV